jgi:hypothetical protein
VPKPVLSLQGFNKLVRAAIDESLLELGPASRDTIYGYLNSYGNLSKWTIPLQLETVSTVLHLVLGDAAAPLEKLIATKLSNKMLQTTLVVRLDNYFDTNVAYNRGNKDKEAV